MVTAVNLTRMATGQLERQTLYTGAVFGFALLKKRFARISQAVPV